MPPEPDPVHRSSIRVLVATRLTQGQVWSDVFYATEGEIVLPSSQDGASVLYGGASHRTTTTFLVVERPGAAYLAELTAAWGQSRGGRAPAIDEIDDWCNYQAELIGDAPVGTVFGERDGLRVVRVRPDQPTVEYRVEYAVETDRRSRLRTEIHPSLDLAEAALAVVRTQAGYSGCFITRVTREVVKGNCIGVGGAGG